MERTGLKSTSTSQKGEYWESYVEMAAWERNAGVYPNKGSTGKVDIVLGIGNDFIPIDVKAMKYNFKESRWGSPKAARPGVYLVLVNPCTKEIRWAKNPDKTPKCPKGLEDFWN